MKKYLMYLGVLGLLAIPAQGAFAWDMSYLNPLPYVGIGQNQTSFSLNPFKGFKNCNPCKKVIKNKCDRCATIQVVPTCTSCQRAFEQQPCPCMKNRY